MKRLLPFLCLIFMACPPPDYPLLFGYNDIWSKSVKFEEGPIKLKINGRMELMGWRDDFDIYMRIEGLDTTEIVFFDTINSNGVPINTTRYFDDKITFESEPFKPYRPQVCINNHRVDVVLSAFLEIHKPYSDMTREEFLYYLDTFRAIIRIDNIFSDPKLIEIRPNRELLLKIMGKWVPALQQEKQPNK